MLLDLRQGAHKNQEVNLQNQTSQHNLGVQGNRPMLQMFLEASQTLQQGLRDRALLTAISLAHPVQNLMPVQSPMPVLNPLPAQSPMLQNHQEPQNPDHVPEAVQQVLDPDLAVQNLDHKVLNPDHRLQNPGRKPPNHGHRVLNPARKALNQGRKVQNLDHILVRPVQSPQVRKADRVVGVLRVGSPGQGLEVRHQGLKVLQDQMLLTVGQTLQIL